MDFPVDPDSHPQSKRRTLLRLGGTLGWWRYESENPPGHVDRNGHTYPDVVTYTIVRPGEGTTAARERVLLADEVIGYVLAAADARGEALAVAYREGLTP